MGIETSVIYGFGFLLEEAQVRCILDRYKNKYDMDYLFHYKLKLPEGFSYACTNGEYEPLAALISPSEDDYESKLMRGEVPLKDFTPVLEWAKNNDVKFSSSIPELHVIQYTC